jgi:hypothetical protein
MHFDSLCLDLSYIVFVCTLNGITEVRGCVIDKRVGWWNLQIWVSDHMLLSHAITAYHPFVYASRLHGAKVKGVVVCHGLTGTFFGWLINGSPVASWVAWEHFAVRCNSHLLSCHDFLPTLTRFVFPKGGEWGGVDPIRWVVWRGVYKQLQPSLCTQPVGRQLLSEYNTRGRPCFISLAVSLSRSPSSSWDLVRVVSLIQCITFWLSL